MATRVRGWSKGRFEGHLACVSRVTNEEARQALRRSQEDDWIPEPRLASRADPCVDASGGPPDARPSDWPRPSSALDHPLNLPELASFLSFRRENRPIARPFQISETTLWSNASWSIACRQRITSGPCEIRAGPQTPSASVHWAEVFHSLSIPVLNFSPLEPPCLRRVEDPTPPPV